MTPEARQKRSEIAKRWQARKTPEQRSASARKGNVARTPEQRRAIALKRCADLGPEGRSARALKRAANMSAERRSEIAKKIWETRKAHATPIRRRALLPGEDKPGTYTIYCLTNRMNGKKYVGQTGRSLAARWRTHLSDAKRGEGCPALTDAILKYGHNIFERETLEIVGSLRASNDAEIRWIAQMNCRVPNGYNYETGGTNGLVHEETRRKMSEAKRAYWAAAPPEVRRAVGKRYVTSVPRERRLEISRLANSPENRAKASVRMREWQASRSIEVRRATAKKASEAARSVNATRTAAQRSEDARKANASRTPAQRSAAVQKQWINLTPAQRSEKMRAMHAARTPEQQHARLLKAWETRRRNKAANIGCANDTAVRG